MADDLPKIILDLSYEIDERINALTQFYKEKGYDDTIEIVNRLSMLYQLSNIKGFRKYIYEICMKTELPPYIKSILATTLFIQNKSDEFAFTCINEIYPKMGDVSTPYKIDFLKMLMESEKYQEICLKYFLDLIKTENMDCKYRFKTIQNLELENSKLSSFFKEQGFLYFMNDEKVEYLYRNLSAQSLCVNKSVSLDKSNYLNDVFTYLYNTASNELVDYNIRADASDMLLQYGNEEYKNKAKEIIEKLGFGTNKIQTLYNNAQNVHTKDIEESVKKGLEYLQNFKIKEGLTQEKVEQEILKLCNTENIHRITLALNRISLDRALYSSFSCTLSHILLQVWSFIIGHEHEEEMKKRLLEELSDTADTCSSGFVSRLVNTLSNFCDFSITISWSTQIASNLNGRLNALIRDMDDLKKQELILTEMASPSLERKNFLRFFRNNISDIREEMYHEFKSYITDVDFDLYFRSAVLAYETGEV